MHRLLVAFLLLVCVTTAAVAQNSRSAVSLNGSDLNACTLTAPCRTFAVALTHTNSGGEVIALDSAGYGQFTVTQPVTVSGAPGVHAALMGSGGNAISVTAGAFDRIVLRNLVALAGTNPSDGIHISSALSVHIINCLVRGFAGHTGVAIRESGAETLIDHSVVEENGAGVVIFVADTAASARVRITDSEIDNNGGQGIWAVHNLRAVVSNTSLSGNDTGVWVEATDATSADMTLEHCIIAHNNLGVTVTNPLGDINSHTVVRLYGNVINYNVNAGVKTGVSIAYTYGNNAINGNNPDVDGGLTALPQQ